MSKRVTIVVVCTFLAIIAGSVSVPCYYADVLLPNNVLGNSPVHIYAGNEWLWSPALTFERVVWQGYAAQIGTPLVLGGLLALALHTRDRRREATA